MSPGLPPDVTLMVARPLAGPYRLGDLVTVVRTEVVEMWIAAGLFTVVD